MAAASAIDAGIQKKIHDSGTTTLISSNEELNDMMKIVQTLEDSNILLKSITKTIENETKVRKEGLLEMLLRTLGASLFGNMLAGKGIVRAGYGNKQAKGIVRASYRSKKVNSSHHLITLKYKSIIRMNLYLMEFILEIICLKKKKDGPYVINLDEYADVGTHWIALYLLFIWCYNNDAIYFDSFGDEHVPTKIRHFIGNKNMQTNIFRI